MHNTRLVMHHLPSDAVNRRTRACARKSPSHFILGLIRSFEMMIKILVDSLGEVRNAVFKANTSVTTGLVVSTTGLNIN